jgi:hypothetical protein
MNPEMYVRTNSDREGATQNILIEWRCRCDDDVDLGRCCLMNDVEMPSATNSSDSRCLVDVELGFEGARKRGDMRMIQCDHNVNVDRTARLSRD